MANTSILKTTGSDSVKTLPGRNRKKNMKRRIWSNHRRWPCKLKKKLVILTTIDGLISRTGTRFISLITGLQSHFQNTNVQINKSQQFAQLFALVPILGWESSFFFFYFVLTDGRVCLMISFTGFSVVVSVNE